MTSREWRQRLERPHPDRKRERGSEKRAEKKAQADKHRNRLADVMGVCCYSFKRRVHWIN